MQPKVPRLEYPRPQWVRADWLNLNGEWEFASLAMDQWAYWNGVTLDFSRRSKPRDNALVEAFNIRFRQECLNEHWFLSVDDAQEDIEAWQNHYNAERPHSSLGNLAPEDFARASAATATPATFNQELIGITT